MIVIIRHAILSDSLLFQNNRFVFVNYFVQTRSLHNFKIIGIAKKIQNNVSSILVAYSRSQTLAYVGVPIMGTRPVGSIFLTIAMQSFYN